MIIAIDGPAASGKGPLGKRLAKHYGYRHLDPGVIYRAVAKAMLDAGAELTKEMLEVCAALELDPEKFGNPALKTQEVGSAASIVSAIPKVREVLPLKIQQYFPHLRDRRNDRRGGAHFLGLQRRISELFGIELERRGDREHLVGQLSAGVQHRLGNRAINHAGIEVTIAVMLGKPLAQRALAGGGRSVDGDDHENSAPNERIIGIKSGKLVAMKAVSSTFTGLSAASPITRADIAMRWSMWVATRPSPGT